MKTPPGDGKFGMDIPAVGGTQTIWVFRELLDIDLSHAISAHFGVPVDHVNGWLALLVNRECQVLRKNGDTCKGHLKDEDIPQTPDLFDPQVQYACPAHISQHSKRRELSPMLEIEAWYIDQRGHLAQIVEQKNSVLRLKYRMNFPDWVGPSDAFKQEFTVF